MSVAERMMDSTCSVAEEALQRLKLRRDAWIKVGIEARVDYLNRCMRSLETVGAAWAEATNDVRGLDPTGPSGAEAWLTELVPTMRSLRLLRESLESGGQPKVPKTWKRGDRCVARVFPSDALDVALFTGFTAEVHLEAGQPLTQGRLYRDKAAGKYREGQIGLVLGAGNVGSICPTDAIYKLFVDDEVVIIKTNPVNAYLSPFWKACLQPLVDDGFVEIVDGDGGSG